MFWKAGQDIDTLSYKKGNFHAYSINRAYVRYYFTYLEFTFKTAQYVFPKMLDAGFKGVAFYVGDLFRFGKATE